MKEKRLIRKNALLEKMKNEKNVINEDEKGDKERQYLLIVTEEDSSTLDTIQQKTQVEIHKRQISLQNNFLLLFLVDLSR